MNPPLLQSRKPFAVVSLWFDTAVSLFLHQQSESWDDMVTCTLGNQKYSVDFISGRALREMEPASKMYGRMVRLAKAATEGENVDGEQITVTEALDVMVKWFCILFGNQFTPDEMYDHYPADRLMHDIALALMAVQTQTTEVLDGFPTKPVTQEAEQIAQSVTTPSQA